jgi:hypothetical protein
LSSVSWRPWSGLRVPNSVIKIAKYNPRARNGIQRISSNAGPNGLSQIPPAHVAMRIIRKNHVKPLRLPLLRVASAEVTLKTVAMIKAIRNSFIIIPTIN